MHKQPGSAGLARPPKLCEGGQTGKKKDKDAGLETGAPRREVPIGGSHG
jgi:hypothetical protein